jgi:hypothetical protein
LDGSTRSRNAFDKSTIDHATGEGAKGLVTLKGEFGELV